MELAAGIWSPSAAPGPDEITHSAPPLLLNELGANQCSEGRAPSFLHGSGIQQDGSGQRDGHSSSSGNTGRLQLFPGKQQGHGHAVIPLLFYDRAVPSCSVCTEEPGIHLPAGGMPGRDGIHGPVAQIMRE